MYSKSLTTKTIHEMSLGELQSEKEFYENLRSNFVCESRQYAASQQILADIEVLIKQRELEKLIKGE